MTNRRTIALAQAAMLACIAMSPMISAQTPKPASPAVSPADAFQRALRQLTAEAEQSWKQHRLARAKPDFANDFRDAIPAELLSSKLVRSLHERSFFDAYIRWQLTSLPGASLPDSLSARQFQNLLGDLPEFIDNPRADRALITGLTSQSQVGPLSESQQEQARKDLTDLDERTRIADELNRPAREFRDWIASQLPQTGERALLAQLERCAAAIRAGWPSDQIKNTLDELFRASAEDPNFTVAQRKAVVDELRHLIDKRRLYVTSATVQNGTIAAQFGDTAIYDFDVRRWARMIVSQ